MAGKSKFQISRSLDERIKRIICDSNDQDLESTPDIPIAYILGFNYGNVTNYVGLTIDYLQHNAVFPVVGLAYFKKSMPSDSEIRETLKPVREHFYKSENGFGSNDLKSDRNEHLYLIYYKNDDDDRQLTKKIYDFNAASFILDQPKLSVLDDTKIYNHSALIKLTTTIRLRLFKVDKSLLEKDQIGAAIDEAKKLLSNDSKNLTLTLRGSNFFTKTPLDSKQLLESLYSHLDAPNDLEQVGDYLPQMTKEEKKKMVDKWRNKVKDQRASLEIELDQEYLTSGDDSPEYYKLDLEEYIYLHVNDSIAKSTRVLLYLLRQKLELLKLTLLDGDHSDQLAPNEIKSCTFNPSQLNHLVPAVYLIPPTSKANYNQLMRQRQQIHEAYLLSFDQPAVRYSQRITSIDLKNDDQRHGYLCNVHVDLIEKSGIKGGSRNIIEGTYTYHHYLQDRIQDNGWGCAYRSLQTIISWFKHQGYIYSPDVCLRVPNTKADDMTSLLREKLTRESRVPTHEEIQAVLVDIGDKDTKFVGSNKWIGSQEVCYVLNHLYNIDSKFISVSSGNELVYKARDLGQHFADQSTPVMIGGGVLAHTIIGLDFNEKNGDVSYLILDPHYTGAEDISVIAKKGWCGWKKNSFWDKSAFYNLCLPQRPKEF